MLKIGESAVFRTYDRRYIYGKVIGVVGHGCYIVVSFPPCATYSDGLYRFTDRNILR